MKKEGLLQRGNVSRPDKGKLMAEAKLVTEEKLQQKAEMENENLKVENSNNLGLNNNFSGKTFSIKPSKSVNRLLKSVNKLTGTEQKISIKEKTETTVIIPEVSETGETNFEDYKIEVICLASPQEEVPKPLKVTKSSRILEMAKQWDQKNTSANEEPLVENNTVEDIGSSLLNNPKMMRRIHNTKRRIFGTTENVENEMKPKLISEESPQN